MNKNFSLYKAIRSAAVLCFTLIICLQPGERVLADKTINSDRTGSVTIRYFDDVDTKTPVNGAQFTFYKIDDSLDTTTYTATTDFDGILKITNMKLGKYRVVETSPAYGHKASASFLLTLPMTENNEWIYDVTVEPKASYELQTTSKSVYSLSGSTGSGTLSSGSLAQSWPYNTSSGLTGSNLYGWSGSTSSSAAGSSSSKTANPAGRTHPANTGDEESTCKWLFLSISAGMILITTSRKTHHI